MPVPDAAGATGIGPGWRIAALVSVVPGLRFRAIDAIEQVRIGVHSDEVVGVADPGRQITITVRAGDGTQRDQDVDISNNNGNWNVNFGGGGGFGPGGGGAGIDFEAGDIIEVEFIQGDPISIQIPPVTGAGGWGPRSGPGRWPRSGPGREPRSGPGREPRSGSGREPRSGSVAPPVSVVVNRSGEPPSATGRLGPSGALAWGGGFSSQPTPRTINASSGASIDRRRFNQALVPRAIRSPLPCPGNR